MAWAAAVLQGIGGVQNAQGQLDQGKANWQALEYNADIADQNAKDATAQGAEEERRNRINSQKVLGEARADYAASGVTSEGTPLDVLKESAKNAELDALNVRHAADIKATAYKNDARMNRIEADAALKATQTSAISALLGGGARAFQDLPYKTQGASPGGQK